MESRIEKKCKDKLNLLHQWAVLSYEKLFKDVKTGKLMMINGDGRLGTVVTLIDSKFKIEDGVSINYDGFRKIIEYYP